MGHLSVYERMIVWGIGTVIAMIGAVKSALIMYGYSHEAMPNYLLLFAGGMGLIVINEVVFNVRKTQLEIDADERVKGLAEMRPQASTMLAICPQCKSRVPSESKYCLECGTDLQPVHPQVRSTVFSSQRGH